MGDIAATIVQTDLDPGILEQLTKALHNAGFKPVKSAPKLPDSLSEPYLLLLDENIGGEDVSTLLPSLKGRNHAIVMLVSSPYLERIAAWKRLIRPGTRHPAIDAFIIKGPPVDREHVDFSTWTTAIPKSLEIGLRRLHGTGKTTCEFLASLCENATPEGIEVTLEESGLFFEITENYYGEMKAVEKAFVEKYKALVNEVITEWGQPAFEGTWLKAGFPSWAAPEAVILAYWLRGRRAAYIAVLHYDKELPYELVLGACIPDLAPDRTIPWLQVLSFPFDIAPPAISDFKTSHSMFSTSRRMEARARQIERKPPPADDLRTI